MHAGVGDHLICNGLTRVLAFSNSDTQFIVPTHRRNIHFLRQMFLDVENVSPVFNDEGLFNNTTLEIVNITNSNLLINFDQSFYSCAGIDFSHRWASFHFPRNQSREDSLYRTLNPNNHKFILINNTSSVGEFPIRIIARKGYLPIKVAHNTNNILDWSNLIENAQEIHCIDNGFLSLVESFHNLKGDLFFHDIKKSQPPILRNKWNYIHY